MPKQRRVQSALLPASPLLITESEDDFDRIRDAFDQELKPRGHHRADVCRRYRSTSPGKFCGSAVAKRASSMPHSALLWKYQLMELLRQPGGYRQ